MIKVFSDSKIFVHCPAGAVTGGAELLHQIVHILRDRGIDAYIVYYGDKDGSKPAEYNCYNVAIASNIENSCKNIEIIYEGVFRNVFSNNQTQKFLWWLSVDHFYIMQTGSISLRNLFAWDSIMGIKAFLRRSYNFVFKFEKDSFFNTFSIEDLKRLNAMHGYQSEYAQNFLQNNGFKEIVALKDFINTDHIFEFKTCNRQDIVLYNPKKGLNFTKKLIAIAPDIVWVPVEKMTRSELVELMRKAKLYIDFGYHPGKDRLPRECAMNGCCIITNTRGSAGFFEDIAIGSEYKFDEHTTTPNEIVERIKYVLHNYTSAINDFRFYREAIRSERAEFEEQVARIFCSNIN